MADTTQIKTKIEPYIRDWLSNQFPGHHFHEKAVGLRRGKQHRFDAVSEDGSVVAAVLCNRARTRTKKNNVNTGFIKKH